MQVGADPTQPGETRISQPVNSQGVSTLTPQPSDAQDLTTSPEFLLPSLRLASQVEIYADIISISPDGRLIAAHNREERQVLLYDLRTDQTLGEIEIPYRSDISVGGVGLVDLVFSPDSKWLVGGGWDQTLFVWKVSEFTLIQSFLHLSITYFDLEFSPNGYHLAYIGSYQDIGTEGHVSAVLAFDSEEGRIIGEDVIFDSFTSSSVSFSTDASVLVMSNTLLSGGGFYMMNYLVCVEGGWEICRREVELFSSVNWIDQAVVSPTGRYLAALVAGPSFEGVELRIWDFNSDTETVISTEDWLRGLDMISFSRDGNLAVSDINRNVIILRGSSWEPIGEINLDTPLGPNERFGIEFSPDGASLITGGTGFPIQIWDIP